MNQWKSLKWFCLGAFMLLNSSCGTVQIKNDEFCIALMPGQGGHCHDLLTSDQRDIPEPAWTQMQPGRISENTQGFADFKSELESACNIMEQSHAGSCVNNTAIQTMKAKLSAILEMARKVQIQPKTQVNLP